MAVTYKDIDLLTQKASAAGTEKIPVSDTQYLSAEQISNIPPTLVTSQPNGGMVVNTFYALGTLTGNVTLSLNTSGIDTTRRNTWHFCFFTGSTAPSIQWFSGSEYIWKEGTPPTINANCFYEIHGEYVGSSKYIFYAQEVELS